jgi:hypothetical protein
MYLGTKLVTIAEKERSLRLKNVRAQRKRTLKRIINPIMAPMESQYPH